MNQWRKVRLDRMLVEYFLRNGYYNSANKLADAHGLRDFTNVGKLNDRHCYELYVPVPLP